METILTVHFQNRGEKYSCSVFSSIEFLFQENFSTTTAFSILRIEASILLIAGHLEN